MGLEFQNIEIDRLASELAEISGENVEQAIKAALVERIGRLRTPMADGGRSERIDAIIEQCARAPAGDSRTDDEIIGYNQYGHFD